MKEANGRLGSIPMMVRRLRRIIGCLLLSALCACGSISGRRDTGIVIARRAQIRSSTAVVAADLLAVERGAVLDILDETTAENGERWYRVRAHDLDQTEGWIEARYVVLQEMIDLSRKLAQEDQNTPAQAVGQLRAASNLRLSPDRSSDDNILMRLESGAHFEIVGWKYTPKPKTAETEETDDVPKSAAPRRAPRREDEQVGPEEEYELWYKVRLDPSVSPAPAGWIYGKQVELAVPSDIIFYRTGREFVAWQRLDDGAVASNDARGAIPDDARPGSWVILERSGAGGPPRPTDPDFDRILVLGYDADKQEHYIAYRSGDVRGFLPLRVERSGSEKTFSVRIQGSDGQIREVRYRVRRDERGLIRVEPPSEVRRR